MTPVRILRALTADVLLAFAAWADRLDTALADACNDPEEDA